MHKLKTLLFITLIAGMFTITATPVKAQTGSWFYNINKNLELLRENTKAAKIHIHMDRSIYNAKDTIWYKIYLVDAASLKPLFTSEIVNVTLWSENKALISQQKIFASNGLAAGQLTLPDSIAAGAYSLVSYTNWMQNSGPEFFFRKTITVLSGRPSETKPVAKSRLSDLTFFPEGGYLIAGLQSKVGFKAIGENGLSVPVSGRITDENGKPVVSFKSLHAGMGSFILKPEPGKMYTAQVNLPDNSTRTFALPEIKKSGLVLSAESLNDSSVAVKITGTPDYYNTTINLIAQSRSAVWFSEKITLNDAAGKRIVLAKKLLPAGITHLTVFNQDGMPEAERLIFVENRQDLKIKIVSGNNSQNRRKPVTLHVETTDSFGRPVAAELSLAVTDPGQTSGIGLENSLSANLLLTSDLAGFVENPGFYFSSNAPANKSALDNLLLTQGWRRFTWKQVFDYKDTSPVYKPEVTPAFSGAVYNGETPLRNAFIYMLSSEGESKVAKTDENGKFSFDLTKLNKNKRFGYQVWQNGIYFKDAAITLNSDTGPDIFQAILPAQSDSAALIKHQIRTKIENAFGLNTGRPEVAQTTTMNWLKVPANRKFRLEDYEPFKDLEDVLNSLVPAVRLKGKENPEPKLMSIDKRDFYTHQPMFLIDGQPTWNNDLALRLNGDLIKQVEIYNSASTLQQFGILGNQGVIAVQTKSGNFKSPDVKNVFYVNGLVQPREFYVPKFTDPQIPDLRPTIYWNPTVKTGPDGKATITFPMSDAAGFRVYVEGITENGLIGTGSAEFNRALIP